MKKLLLVLIASLFVLGMCHNSFAQDTMAEAFSLEGAAHVGIGEAPWQHRLLYPIGEKQLKEIETWIIENGKIYWGFFSAIAIYRDSNSTIYAVGVQPGVGYLVVDDPNDQPYLLTLVYAGGEITRDRMVDVVAHQHPETGGPIVWYYGLGDDPKETPSIYNSIFLKKLWRFYTSKVNPDWEPEDLLKSWW